MSGPGLELPPSDERFKVLRRLRPPAFILLAVGVLSIFFTLAGLVLALLRVPSPMPPPPGEAAVALELTWGLAVGLLASLVCGVLTVWGALSAMRLRGYGLAMVGAISSLFPLSPTCPIAIPFAVWMLMVLTVRPEVRKAFSS